jgi:ABC-type sugar transport system substrate-binding protein
MAALGVQSIVDHLLGKTVPRRIDTGVVLVTAANLDSPEIQELLSPPLDKYLQPGE